MSTAPINVNAGGRDPRGCLASIVVPLLIIGLLGLVMLSGGRSG